MTQVAGIVMVFDMKDVGLTQLKGISASFAKRMVHFLAVSSSKTITSWDWICFSQSCVPVRINAIHIVNEPAIFSMFFTIFKAFLTERMKKRVSSWKCVQGWNEFRVCFRFISMVQIWAPFMNTWQPNAYRQVWGAPTPRLILTNGLRSYPAIWLWKVHK